MDAENPTSACRYVLHVEGEKEKDRSRKAWFKLAGNFLWRMRLRPELAQDHMVWKKGHYKVLPP